MVQLGLWPRCFSATTAHASSGSSISMIPYCAAAVIWSGTGARSATHAPTASEEPTASYARLIRAADVLVESFAPSSRYQAIVPFDWLSALNPRLVHCSITAYGKHGPLKDEAPIDDLVMARMGILGS